MEIYTNSKFRKVLHDTPVAPNDGAVSIDLYRGRELVYTVTQATYADDLMSFDLPYFLDIDEQRLGVHWKFTYTENGQNYEYDRFTYLDVVTPVLNRREILEIHPSATEDEVVRIEKAVRHIINAHTGQTFGRFVGTYNVRGTGNEGLAMPQRLISLASVNGTVLTDYSVGAEGLYLFTKPLGAPAVKADDRGYHQHVGGVIHNPYSIKRTRWASGETYEITGVWGWEEVPAAIKEAARLLVNDYACGDAQYRDRYLTSMTAADWRIQFNDGAFAKTGNVRADQLLNEFTLKRGWAVI